MALVMRPSCPGKVYLASVGVYSPRRGAGVGEMPLRLETDAAAIVRGFLSHRQFSRIAEIVGNAFAFLDAGGGDAALRENWISVGTLWLTNLEHCVIRALLAASSCRMLPSRPRGWARITLPGGREQISSNVRPQRRSGSASFGKTDTIDAPIVSVFLVLELPPGKSVPGMPRGPKPENDRNKNQHRRCPSGAARSTEAAHCAEDVDQRRAEGHAC